MAWASVYLPFASEISGMIDVMARLGFLKRDGELLAGQNQQVLSEMVFLFKRDLGNFTFFCGIDIQDRKVLFLSILRFLSR